MIVEPLIIIATPNICWLHPEVPYPVTPEEIADEGCRCRDAGATVLHTHGEGQWIETIDAVRAKCDIIIQCGMSSLTIPERMDVFKHRADMISIIVSHHDEAFAQGNTNVLHSREEMEEYARLSSSYGVVLEHEIWHTGSIWNMNYLIQKKAITPPYVATFFLGWPGGTWSPPTIEEYFYRRKHMPAGSVVNVSVMGREQRDVLTAAILQGDHVRVGTEDYPFLYNGQLASTHELVAEIAEVARALGRPLATVQDARRIIGLEAKDMHDAIAVESTR
jgi:3-keto-5-aminohexanoate cleavage enzyme